MQQMPPPDIAKLRKANDVNGLITALTYVQDRNIRLAAVKALGEIGGATVTSILMMAFKSDKFRDLWGPIRQALIEIGPPAVEKLIADLNHGDSRAANILGKIGDSRALNPLIEASKGSVLRLEATKALDELGDSGAVDQLLALLDDKDGQVRKAALKALKQFDDPQAKQAVAGIEGKQGFQDKGSLASYYLTETVLGNQLDLEVTTEKFCVYCEHLRDPKLSIPDNPKGAGECSHQGSPHWEVSLDYTCSLWKSNSRVRFWLSKGYMEHNREGWPRQPWYTVFDDGPDGEKGTR